MSFDTVYFNGTVFSMDEGEHIYEWIGIKDGKICGLGKGMPTGGAKEQYDLQGKAVLPGLSDCHVHVMNTGIQLKSVRLDTCSSIDEVLERLEERCSAEPGTGWVFGSGYLEPNIKELRYPDKKELDRISYGHKIIIFAATLHACALNSIADSIADVPEELPGVEKRDGIRTGVYKSDESVFIANRNVFSSFSDEEIWSLIEDCVQYAVTKGVTAMHGLFGQFVQNDRDVDIVLARKDRLPLDMTVFYQTWDVEKAIKKGLNRVGGCLTLDGAAFEHTMANFEPYEDCSELRGVLYHNDQEVYEFLSEGHKKNLQCTMHAVGERAIDQLLYAYHRVIGEQGKKDLRHRLEHFCLPTASQIAMAKKLGIILSMQPGFSYLWDNKGHEFAQILGRERADRIDPFNRIISEGNIVISGSDSPVTDIDPLLYIAHCVDGYNPIRNITVTEAIKMCTVNAAYAVGKENETGTLELGKSADLIVINKNPYVCAREKNLYDMRVERTVKSGKITYVREG